MKLDPRLWAELEAHGVTPAHIEMLVRLIQSQRNGSVEWHFVHGQLQQCRLELVMPGAAKLRAVSETVLAEGTAVGR